MGCWFRQGYSSFYITLISFPGVSSADTSVVIECLDAMISKRSKQVQIMRIMAYVKRLCSLSLTCLPNGTLGYMGFIKDALKVSTEEAHIEGSEQQRRYSFLTLWSYIFVVLSPRHVEYKWACSIQNVLLNFPCRTVYICIVNFWGDN